jgi:hypothetical protein
MYNNLSVNSPSLGFSDAPNVTDHPFMNSTLTLSGRFAMSNADGLMKPYLTCTPGPTLVTAILIRSLANPRVVQIQDLLLEVFSRFACALLVVVPICN